MRDLTRFRVYRCISGGEKNEPWAKFIIPVHELPKTLRSLMVRERQIYIPIREENAVINSPARVLFSEKRLRFISQLWKLLVLFRIAQFVCVSVCVKPIKYASAYTVSNFLNNFFHVWTLI